MDESKYVSVQIHLDEMWTFSPLLEGAYLHYAPTMKIQRELYDEYISASRKFSEVTNKMEKLWRVQENRDVELLKLEVDPIPEHYLLKKE